MLLNIRHRTEYHYEIAPHYGVMRLRVAPRSLGPQRVLDWHVELDGAERQASYRDHMGNEVWLVSLTGGQHHVAVTAAGRVETRDTAGVFGTHRALAPLWLFTRPTPMTEPGKRVTQLIGDIRAQTDPGADALGLAHRIMGAVADAIVYDVGDTNPGSTAEDALIRGAGVCQDHAHVMAAVARGFGIPARYVSGYLRLDDRIEQTATHAWAELHLDGLGWVGFDPSNRISPDARYVRLAVGRDYDEASPMGGVRYGSARERLNVQLHISGQ